MERGIKANPDKCAAIIAMRSPTSVKEVQQLTGRMAALSRFVSAGGEKGHPYFQCLKRNSRFAWTDECEAAFIKLKEYLATPPVLCKPVAAVLHGDIASYQLCAGPGAGPDSKAHLFRKQGLTRRGDEIPGVGEGSVGGGVFGQEAPSLLPQLHGGSDDEPPYTEGAAEA